VGTALTPILEGHCITSWEHRKKVSKEGFKYLIFYVLIINCIKIATITRYRDWMTKICRFDSWHRQEVFHVSR
jgi:transposase